MNSKFLMLNAKYVVYPICSCHKCEICFNTKKKKKRNSIPFKDLFILAIHNLLDSNKLDEEWKRVYFTSS
jgi:hypothetical protein